MNGWLWFVSIWNRSGLERAWPAWSGLAWVLGWDWLLLPTDLQDRNSVRSHCDVRPSLHLHQHQDWHLLTPT